MTVAASKVKSLCTGPEIALVRASRKPELDQHSAAELKSLATRARKLFDKWQGQKRGQARERGRQIGQKSEAENTKLKMQIFREALDAFEAQLAKVSADGAKKPAKPAQRAKTKQARAAEHRQSRAAVRAGMTVVTDLKNQDRAAKAKRAKTAAPAKKAAATKKTPAAKKPQSVGNAKPQAAIEAAAAPAAKSAKSAKKGAKKAAKKPAALAPQSLSTKQQLRAMTKAKQTRIDKSGKSNRVLGHVSARGKRAQARRDSRN